MFTVLIDPARFAGLDWFRRETEGFVAYVKASPPVDPAAPVLVPGEPERIAREKRLRDGIEVDADHLGGDRAGRRPASGSRRRLLA